MTQVFLIFVPSQDVYIIKSVGINTIRRVVYRDEGMTDEKFKEKAESQFDKYITDNQILTDALIVKSTYIF